MSKKIAKLCKMINSLDSPPFFGQDMQDLGLLVSQEFHQSPSSTGLAA